MGESEMTERQHQMDREIKGEQRDRGAIETEMEER